jgi:NAD(P)-dependent dehydrogenase (short-subunit alcohol dehydrogenase family)
LVGKVAVVTGAGRGVGRAYANALAAEGAKVLVNDLGVSVEGVGSGAMAADEAVAEIRAAGGIAAANYDDVSNFAGAGRLIKTAVDIYGSLDILVANAGGICPTNLFEAKEEDWNSVLAVHANGTFNCYRHSAPIMMRQSGGTIITTGADVDRYLTRKDAYPGLGAYRAAKAAILVLTLSAADELRPYNINVNSIMPGATATRMQGAFYESLQAKGGQRRRFEGEVA